MADVTAHAIRAVQAQPTRAELLGCTTWWPAGKTHWHVYAQYVLD